MGKLMELYDGVFEVSVGDKLVLVDRGHKHKHKPELSEIRFYDVEVLKVGREYITINLGGTRFKDGTQDTDSSYFNVLCKSVQGYKEIFERNRIINLVEHVLRYDRLNLNYRQAVDLAAMLNIPLNK